MKAILTKLSDWTFRKESKYHFMWVEYRWLKKRIDYEIKIAESLSKQYKELENELHHLGARISMLTIDIENALKESK